MKKKRSLKKYNFGKNAIDVSTSGNPYLALFNLSAQALAGLTTQSVAQANKALNQPEQDFRNITESNAQVMAYGGRKRKYQNGGTTGKEPVTPEEPLPEYSYNEEGNLIMPEYIQRMMNYPMTWQRKQNDTTENAWGTESPIAFQEWARYQAAAQGLEPPVDPYIQTREGNPSVEDFKLGMPDFPEWYKPETKTQKYSKTVGNMPQVIDSTKPMTNDNVSIGTTYTPDEVTNLTSSGFFANGGIMPPNAEVENNEAFQLPNGDVGQFKGKTHPEGGIDVSLPAGTKIYSDRIKVNGKEIQKRKLQRERRLAKIQKKLDANPQDKILQGTLDRVKQANQKMEATDMKVQDTVNTVTDMGQRFAAYGMIKKYANGGTIDPLLTGGGALAGMLDDLLIEPPDIDLEEPPNEEEPYSLYPAATPTIPTRSYTGSLLGGKDVIPRIAEKKLGDDFLSKYLRSPDVTELPVKSKTAEELAGEAEVGEGNMFTQGDTMGLLGNVLGSVGPLATTLINRAGDTPNVNAFRDFGMDALLANEEAMGKAAQIRDAMLQDVSLSEEGLRRRSRGSARSVNTLRALDQAAHAQTQKARRDVFSNYAQQTMNLLDRKSQLENMQDKAVMGGEQQRDLADRQDRDAYYTQLAQNIGNMAEFMQKTGSDLNKAQRKKDFLGLLPGMSEYGIGLQQGADGDWYMTDSSGKKVKIN